MYEAHKDLEKHINTRANLADTEYPVTREMQDVSEEGFPVEESIPVEYSAEFDEYNEKAKTGEPAEEADSFAAHLKKYVKLISAATAVAAALGISIFGIGTPKTAPGGTTAPTLPTVTPVTPTANAYGDIEDVLDTFSVGNVFPDFDGDYAWAGTGPENSEEYLYFTESGVKTYLWAGGYYTQRGVGIEKSRTDVRYDPDENTMVIRDFTCDHLDANLMGNGFFLEVHGDCRIGSITFWGAMYGCSIMLIGDGTLTVNEDMSAEYGILFNCEDSASLLMVNGGHDAGAPTLNVYGSTAAIFQADSKRAQGIYYLGGMEMFGGKRECGILSRDEENNLIWTVVEDPYNLDPDVLVCFTIVDENGFSKHVIFRPAGAE